MHTENSISYTNLLRYPVQVVCQECIAMSRALHLGAIGKILLPYMMYMVTCGKFKVLKFNDDVFAPLSQQLSLYATKDSIYV